MRLNITIFILFLGIGMNSCSDEEVQINESLINIAQTRSISEFSEFYYYYKGEKRELSVNPSKRYIITHPKTENVSISNRSIVQNMKYKNSQGYIVEIDGREIAKADSHNRTTINSLQDDPNILAIEYVIGDSIPVSNLFYIKLKHSSDINILEQKAAEIGCLIEGVMDSDNTWIRLSNSKVSILNTSLEASNHLFETGLFADVDPGFCLRYEPNITPSDYFYNSQWGLKGYYGIQAESAWNITLGSSSITVAVIDGGIYTQHPDLAGRLLPYAYNCDNGSNSPNYSDHGTMCAGIIAANHNAIAIAGVAPNVKLMNISSNFPNVANLSELLANGINRAWQNGADVINISWGDQGGQYYNQLHSALLEDALSKAMTSGRNGKGTVICFASGNHKRIDYPGYCNSDIMVVGSTDSTGKVATYSGHGKELDVVAPGDEIISLNASGHISSASGTSFAAPHVSGIAALILSINPNLTQKQVCTIINETTGRERWNNNDGFGLVRASQAVEVTAGSYTINNEWGSSAFAIAKFCILYLPRSAKVKWSTAQNVATVIRNVNDTIEYHYSFSGRSMKDEIKATITYCGMVSNISYPITVFNEPKIFGVERIHYSPSPDRIDLKVTCADPNAQITWSGSDSFAEFPYLGDASFMEFPNLYKSLYAEAGTHLLSVKAENQYAFDIYNFRITQSSLNALPVSKATKKTVYQLP